MKRDETGFTLLEVVVALAVLAIALGAVIQAIGSSTNNAAYLRDKTLAGWVAANKAAEMQSLDGKLLPPLGKTNGVEDMANHEWHWTVNVTESTAPDVRRMDIEVRRERNDKQPLVTLIALAGKRNA